MPELEHITDLDGRQHMGDTEVVTLAAVNADGDSDHTGIVTAEEADRPVGLFGQVRTQPVLEGDGATWLFGSPPPLSQIAPASEGTSVRRGAPISTLCGRTRVCGEGVVPMLPNEAYGRGGPGVSAPRRRSPRGIDPPTPP